MPRLGIPGEALRKWYVEKLQIFPVEVTFCVGDNGWAGRSFRRDGGGAAAAGPHAPVRDQRGAAALRAENTTGGRRDRKSTKSSAPLTPSAAHSAPSGR